MRPHPFARARRVPGLRVGRIGPATGRSEGDSSRAPAVVLAAVLTHVRLVAFAVAAHSPAELVYVGEPFAFRSGLAPVARHHRATPGSRWCRMPAAATRGRSGSVFAWYMAASARASSSGPVTLSPRVAVATPML